MSEFKNYIFLPSEIRTMIIDEMQPGDRCRFTRCSKLCNQEAKKSKNYIYGLELNFYDRLVCIKVLHDKGHGFFWIFCKLDETKYMICENRRGEEFWREELDSSTDLQLYAAEKSKNVLLLHQNRIKRVFFFGIVFFESLRNYNFEVDSFMNLEEISLAGGMDVRGYLSKCRGALKHLNIRQTNLDMDNFADCEQIYHVQQSLDVPNLKLNNEQFLQLSAPVVEIKIGYLTTKDVYQFISCWKNGTIGKKVEKYEWRDVEPSEFDVPELFRRLGMGFEASQREECLELEVKQSEEDGKTAKLTFPRFLDLFPEIRMEIVDQMEPADRCRFKGCSRLSKKEARASKNYIYGLQFYGYSEKELDIYIKHDISFEEDDRKRCICAVEHFKRLLKLYQRKIKHLAFYESLFDKRLKNFDFGLENLKNVDDLAFDGCMEIIFPKIQRPLKALNIIQTDSSSTLKDCEHIYKVREELQILGDKTKLNNEQFLRLSAPIVEIHIGYLTETDIFNFIRSWQNGSVGKKVECYRWRRLYETKFDVEHLFRLLGLTRDEALSEEVEFEIKHYKEDGKTTKLKYNRWELEFYTRHG